MKTRIVLFIVLTFFCVTAPAAAESTAAPAALSMTLPVVFGPTVLGNSTTPQALRVHATIESIGIASPYTGDDDKDGKAVAWYRPTGTPTWLEAHPMFAGRGSREFRVSLVQLTPDTSYDIEVRYTDPDGVTPSTVSAAIRTRPDYPVIGSGAISTVSDIDDLQDEIDNAQPGDTIRLTAGTYYGGVEFQNNDSGAAGDYITVEPAPGATVIFDGSDPDINDSTNRWTYYSDSSEGPVYYIDLSWGDTECSDATLIPNYVGEKVSGVTKRYLLFSSDTEDWNADFLEAPAGKAYYVCNGSGPGPEGRLYVVTYGGVDPDNVDMFVSEHHRAFRVEGASYIRIRDFTFRHYALSAVHLLDEDSTYGADHNIIENNTFEGIGEWAIRVEGDDGSDLVADNLIQYNTITETGFRDSGWVWDVAYHHGRGDISAISMYDGGPGNIFRGNTIHSGHDGINVNNGSDDADVYDNTISDCMDNAIEVDEHPGQNVRIWGNTIEWCFASATMQEWENGYPGPVYFFRNVIIGGEDPEGRTDYLGDDKGYAAGHAFKVGGGDDHVGALYLYHNTIVIDRDDLGQGHGLNDAGGDHFDGVTTRNNIWAVSGDPINLDYNTSITNHDLDCDNLHDVDSASNDYLQWGADGGPEGDGGYETLNEFQDETDQELNGISDEATLFDANWHLQAGSPDIDAGCIIKGFNDRGPDAYAGSAPDIGAFERQATGCTPGVVSRSLSTITALDTQITADGLELADVEVTIKDECGNPISGRSVSLSSSRGSKDTISPSSANTNSSGKASFTVKSSKTSDYTGGAYAPSTITATAGSITIDQTADVAFDCFSGLGLVSGGAYSIQLTHTNDTPVERRLLRLTVEWPSAAGRNLTTIELGPDTLFSGSRSGSPLTIQGGDWLSPSTMRDVASGATETLEVTFNFNIDSLPGSDNDFIIKTKWRDMDNTSSNCFSPEITVTR